MVNKQRSLAMIVALRVANDHAKNISHITSAVSLELVMTVNETVKLPSFWRLPGGHHIMRGTQEDGDDVD